MLKKYSYFVLSLVVFMLFGIEFTNTTKAVCGGDYFCGMNTVICQAKAAYPGWTCPLDCSDTIHCELTNLCELDAFQGACTGTNAFMCTDSAQCGIGYCSAPTNVSCVWSNPLPTPTPPPPTAPPPTAPPPTAPPTTCTISLAPTTTTLTIGGALTGTITATVSCTAAINGVTFSSSNGAVATVVPAAPTQDTTSPYSTVVTGLTVGSSTITGTVFSGGVARASATATVNVTSLPCTVTTAPATLSLVPGGATGTVSASVTSGLGTATVSSMAFGSYNTAVATVNPASDVSNPYSTAVSAVSVGSAAVWATATLSDNRTCQSIATTDSDITVSAPTCTISLAPATTALTIGGTNTGTITATVSCTAPINSVNFSSSNGALVTVAPASDTTSPYTATVTGIGVGSSTITGTVFSGGAARASATATVTVTSLACRVTTSPATPLNLVPGGGAGIVSASVSSGLGTATVTNMAFGSYNTTVATVSPANDASNPYSTNVTPVSAGSTAVWATATLSDNRTCQSIATTDSDIIVATPTCTITLTPANTPLTLGGPTKTIDATVVCNTPVDQVTFSSSNTGVVTTSSPGAVITANTTYRTTITGVSTGAVIITGSVYAGGSATPFTNTAIVQVTALSAWFQVDDADVTSGGDITTNILDPNIFGLNGLGGFPGIPMYSDTTDLNPASKANVNNWVVRSASTNARIYDYKTLTSQIPADVIPNALTTATVNNTNFNASTGNYYGYTWYKYSGGPTLSINGALSISAGEKVILLVDSADLLINARIVVANTGFFMAVVGETSTGTRGNIIIDPTVGGNATPDLEGIYVADNVFDDSLGNLPLWIRGSVAAYGGVLLQRDLGAGNVTTPAELIEFAPDQIALYPSKLGVRKLNWKEVAP